ncbi:hypothetical protein [Variovorax sp. PAMC26660]|uniref:hypothetical protein n=1 Tax=Variovorax sp. PAMC26660 TaxID=2762322 RepID=UPI00164D1F8A|nr:hypothetical protein [Variovorax sp. PAMC26660]QNK65774.1 hypothetical protein H7F35_21465 [Variovorax sp. PAMC26660]
MNSFKTKFWAWYDAHIAAAWWASTAMWTGVAAGLVQYMPDWIQTGLDQMDLLGGVFAWDQQTKIRIQGALLFIVLPIAKAWRQNFIRARQLKQAVKTGEVTSAVDTDLIDINVGKATQ